VSDLVKQMIGDNDDASDLACEVLREVLAVPGVTEAVLLHALKEHGSEDFRNEPFNGCVESLTDVPFHVLWARIQRPDVTA
jgi:hypothetical protein